MVYHSTVLFIEKGPTLFTILLLHASVSILANISIINKCWLSPFLKNQGYIQNARFFMLKLYVCFGPIFYCSHDNVVGMLWLSFCTKNKITWLGWGKHYCLSEISGLVSTKMSGDKKNKKNSQLQRLEMSPQTQTALLACNNATSVPSTT